MSYNDYFTTYIVNSRANATHAAEIVDSITGKVIDTLYFHVSPYVSRNSILAVIKKDDRYYDNRYFPKITIVNH